MKSFFITLLLISAMFFLSCNNDNPLIFTEKQVELIPLHTGNTWEYTITRYDSAGNLANTGNEHREVISDTLIEGEHWYKVAGFLGYYMANRADGVWARNFRFAYTFENRELDDPFLRIPFPLELNESIKINSIETYTLLEKNISLTVPAGTFKCYLYRLNYPKSLGSVSEYFLYYSPGVGLIKERWNIEHATSPLISYYAGETVLTKFRVY